MRIIHWIKQFYPYMGGGETALYELCKIIEKEPLIDDNIIITTRLPGTKREERLFKKTRIIRIGFPTDYDNNCRLALLFKNTIRDFSVHSTMKKFVNDKTIIHVHGPITPPFILRIFRKTFKNSKHFQPWAKFAIPVIMHYHAIPTWDKEFLKELDLKNSELIICVDRGIEKFVDSKKSIMIPNGIDTDKFKPLNKKRKWISFFGRLIPIKGWETFVKATEGMDNILIIGHGPDENKLRNKYDGKLLTSVDNDEIVRYYSETDILVSPLTNLMGISRVLLEAMASGCLVIKSDYDPDTYPVIDGINGFIFKTDSPENLKQKILEILGLPENKKTMIRKKAREVIIKDFEIKKLGKNIIDEYTKISTKSSQSLSK